MSLAGPLPEGPFGRAPLPLGSVAGFLEPNDPFLTACRGEHPSHTPVWFMRQAGRALPEYRSIRGEGSILDAIRHPELATEITLQPVRRYGVDAAILFSDIVVPVAAIGFGVDVNPGLGPVVERPFASAADLQRLRPLEPEVDMPWAAKTVAILVKELTVPLIGFAGGPFTLASYLIEGGPSRDYAKTKRLMHGDPALWSALLERLADLSARALVAQVQAGAAAVQVFDSWAGSLSPHDYERFVLPAARRIFSAVEGLGVPRIHFGVGTGEILDLMVEAGADVIGVDWRVPLGRAAAKAPGARALQGNLDPAACLAPWDAVAAEARLVLESAPAGMGHVFNLGHGVLPGTDPAVLSRLVELVHEEPPR
ncbi:MAG: uroporphyrinogen decarboxylase [Acidimicrobiales bacterium]|nr:uroporphyrinogen decarboxylase [Acidimicrobiales bacterium]